jgi:hypothetical protein
VALCGDLCIHHIVFRSFSHKAFASCGGEFACSRINKEIPLTGSHSTLLCACVESTQGILSTYLLLEDSFARSLPNSYLLWTLYAAVSLIKLRPFEEYILSREPTVSLPSPTDRDSTLYYLDAMINKMSRISQNKYYPQSKSGGLAFKKLKSFMMKKREVCINAKGGHKVGPTQSNDPVYSVFGQDSEGKSGSQLGLGQQEPQISHDTSKDPVGYRHSASQQVSSPILGQLHGMHVSSSASGSAEQGDSAYDYMMDVNTDWDDFTLDPEELKKVDALMMDYEASWAKYLF